jgi:hypothetical protein
MVRVREGHLTKAGRAPKFPGTAVIVAQSLVAMKTYFGLVLCFAAGLDPHN